MFPPLEMARRLGRLAALRDDRGFGESLPLLPLRSDVRLTLSLHPSPVFPKNLRRLSLLLLLPPKLHYRCEEVSVSWSVRL